MSSSSCVEHELTCTGAHPFWSIDANNFTPASALTVGTHLKTESQSAAVVSRITVERALVGTTFTTYNFAVAEFHTYYAGSSAVLVHNEGETPCDIYAATIVAVKKEFPQYDEWTQSQIALAKMFPPSTDRSWATAEFMKDFLTKLKARYPDGLITPRIAVYGGKGDVIAAYAQAGYVSKGSIVPLTNDLLEWNHLWKKQLIRAATLDQRESFYKQGLAMEVAEPFMHAAGPYGLDYGIDQFIRAKFNKRNLAEAELEFRRLTFSEARATLKQYYNSRGIAVPENFGEELRLTWDQLPVEKPTE